MGDAHSIQSETDPEKALRRTRLDDRQGEADPDGYVAPGGQVLAVPGSSEAPYAHIIGVDLRGDNRGVISTYSSTALENQAVIKRSAGRIYAPRILLAAAALADRWLLYFDVDLDDNVTAPLSNGDIPVWRVVLPTGALESADEVPNGFFFERGIVVAISTTPIVLTLPAAPEALFQVGFV